ncbi:ROK family transcriptional regulator [Paenibacillus sp. W2I17]|uniref:ROK family transcriptional regulator n=1 Tax=Paenibacillus sp. W2I17 TaxID=3042311 RepID=UPI00277D62D0|nr:ROK family transcriptional regulator [Paenibacillus sp. W2I17]MDQ0657602.1 putative NBD/HSP70 family sugar kinase [Paenibacillus sp. W2I17]
MLQEFVGLMSPKTKSLKALYSLVRKHGPIRINELVELSGYKHSTCSRLVEELVQAGLIYDSGSAESKVGRKPAFYVITPDSHYMVGVEISSLFIVILLLDLNLQVLEEVKFKMDFNSPPQSTLNLISDSIEDMLLRHHVQQKHLLGIGVGAIGSIERENGTIHFKDDLSNDWNQLNIIESLEKRFSTVVLLDHGANLAALGEYRSNYWRETENLVYTSSGIGIRSGIILQGQVVGSKLDMDESFGHITVDVHGRKCACGAYGCLEAYSSLPAVREEVIRQIKRGKSSSLLDTPLQADDIQFHHILDALKQGDPLCSDVVRDAAYYYGIGITNLIQLLRPDIVIIGGGLGGNIDFYEMTLKTVQERTKQYKNLQVKIIRASSGYNAVAVGAGCMIFDYFLEEKTAHAEPKHVIT